MKNAILRNIDAMLEEGREEELSQLLAELHPADIAEVLSPLDMAEAIKVIALLDIQLAADVLVEMNDSSRDQVASVMPLERLTELVAEMDSDDAADIVGELPEEEAHKVLAAIEPEDSNDVRRLLLYDTETAGGLMQVELVAVAEDETVTEVVEKIRRSVEEVGDINLVFVVDENKVLIGQVSLRDLILALPDQVMRELMHEPLVVVEVNEDQESVAQKFQKYDIKAAPVVDELHHLLGRITVDDIIDVVHEETDQDFYRMAGSSEEEVYSSGMFKIASLRVPWLLFNLGGGFITSLILRYFEANIVTTMALIAFVPMVMGLSGAVGSQAATITVRGLAVGRILKGQVLRNLTREMQVSVIIATSFALIIAVISGSQYDAARLGVAVGCSVLTAILVSTFLGAVAPLFFRAINIDPALASGPVVTSTNDVVSLLIYMTMGSFIMSL